MQFDNICDQVHETAVEKGFWPEEVDDIFIAKHTTCVVEQGAI